MSDAARFDLKAATEALLRRMGAAELQDSTGYPFTLLCTRGGPLHVHPRGDFIACRFEWAAAADGRVNGYLNTCSGKWNHHPTGDPDQAFLDRFEAAVRAIA